MTTTKLIIVIMLFLFGCTNKKTQPDTLNYIDVYYIPIESTVPGTKNRRYIKRLEPKQISDEQVLDTIYSLISKELVPISDYNDFGNLFLYCDLRYKNKTKVDKLYFDKYVIKINRDFYEKNERLISLLTRDFY